jgi:hypothetical protein
LAISDIAYVCQNNPQSAQNNPQSAYSGLQKSLQQEWQFVQQVVKDVKEELQGIEQAIAHIFLWTLFDDNYNDNTDPGIFWPPLPCEIFQTSNIQPHHCIHRVLL